MCECANTHVCTCVSVCTRATRADFSLGRKGQACETSERNTRRERGGRRRALELCDFAQGHLETSGDSLGCSTPGQGVLDYWSTVGPARDAVHPGEVLLHTLQWAG